MLDKSPVTADMGNESNAFLDYSYRVLKICDLLVRAHDEPTIADLPSSDAPRRSEG